MHSLEKILTRTSDLPKRNTAARKKKEARVRARRTTSRQNRIQQRLLQRLNYPFYLTLIRMQSISTCHPSCEPSVKRKSLESKRNENEAPKKRAERRMAKPMLISIWRIQDLRVFMRIIGLRLILLIHSTCFSLL